MSQHPRETPQLFGHEDAFAEIKQAFSSNKMHHAWIISGNEGIGKATFAYHFARFALAHSSPLERVNAWILAKAHPNLFILEQPEEKTATGLSRDISIENVRKIHGFFGETATDEGYRICIIDALEDLNRNSANSLLKILEEPPKKSLFLLISHEPYRLLPTIRSRARFLPLKPLSNDDLMRSLFALGFNEVEHVLGEAKGSVASAIELLNPHAYALNQLAEKVFVEKPPINEVLALAEMVSGKDFFLFTRFTSLYNAYLVERAEHFATHNPLKVSHFTSLYSHFNSEVQKLLALNLERKPFVIASFGWLE